MGRGFFEPVWGGRDRITGVGRDSLKKVLTFLLTCESIDTMGVSKITERY